MDSSSLSAVSDFPFRQDLDGLLPDHVFNSAILAFSISLIPELDPLAAGATLPPSRSLSRYLQYFVWLIP